MRLTFDSHEGTYHSTSSCTTSQEKNVGDSQQWARPVLILEHYGNLTVKVSDQLQPVWLHGPFERPANHRFAPLIRMLQVQVRADSCWAASVFAISFVALDAALA